MRRHLRRLVPPLYFKHRGYLMVVSVIGWVHLLAAADNLLPHSNARHAYPPWEIHNRVMPNSAWGLLHLIAFLGVVIGLYRSGADLFLVRLVSAVSASIFTLLGISYSIATISTWPQSSLLGPGFCGFIVISSIAAVLEPATNPAQKPRIAPEDRHGPRR